MKPDQRALTVSAEPCRRVSPPLPAVFSAIPVGRVSREATLALEDGEGGAIAKAVAGDAVASEARSDGAFDTANLADLIIAASERGDAAEMVGFSGVMFCRCLPM